VRARRRRLSVTVIGPAGDMVDPVDLKSTESIWVSRPLAPKEAKSHTGWLLEHGRTPPESKPSAMQDYFMVLVRERALLIFHPDLERAVGEAPGGVRRGEMLHVQAVPRLKMLYDPGAERYAQRVLTGTDTPDDHHYWIVRNSRTVRDDFDRAARLRDPVIDLSQGKLDRQLQSHYQFLEEAKRLAEVLGVPKDQQSTYLQIIRDGLADRVALGEPFPEFQTPKHTRRMLLKLLASQQDPARDKPGATPEFDEPTR
jgi:hypothetical protein